MKKGKLISVPRRTAAGAFIILNLNPVTRKITIIEECNDSFEYHSLHVMSKIFLSRHALTRNPPADGRWEHQKETSSEAHSEKHMNNSSSQKVGEM